MFGIFLADINFGVDGGLYPELVKNRSFEFSEPLAAWHEIMVVNGKGIDVSKGELLVRTDDPLNASNPHYLRVRTYDTGYGFFNPGFRGMGVKEGAISSPPSCARTDQPRYAPPSPMGRGTKSAAASWMASAANGTIRNRDSRECHRAESAAEPVRRWHGFARPRMVSLFPVDTWNHRPNGLRKDLVQLLYDMHPGFIRFPGGCIVEGRRLMTRYRWKTTVGDIAERHAIVNRWNDEFDFRPAPDYFQSFGLGFYEYFQLAEDIGARPLPILNCGMACQFNSSETAKLDELNEYIQDALDLIEFANGPVDSPWGKIRAQMGHPAPFHLEMMGVGNEQWGPRYLERYKVFADALKAKHPEIKLVAGAGPAPAGEPFETMWTNWRQLKPDFVDEHYYMTPDWFLEQ